jgi:probable HAF family extracellular repeat protein
MQDLGTLAAPYNYLSVALAINDLGQVAGYSQSYSGAAECFLYSGGSMQNLGLISGEIGALSQGWSLNNSGQLVGCAFIYSNGVMQSLT